MVRIESTHKISDRFAPEIMSKKSNFIIIMNLTTSVIENKLDNISDLGRKKERYFMKNCSRSPRGSVD